MATYLDCNATTPMEPEVRDAVLRFMDQEYGNAGSRTHEFGARAKQAVQEARDRVAEVVAAQRDDVLFTSGATESNNLALLGLVEHGEKTQRKHVVTTAIEHKAVLEPVEALQRRGFEVTVVRPTGGGVVEPGAIHAAIRTDTLFVSVMHVNNETGVEQPLGAIGEVLAGHEAFFHVDAAQGFGKLVEPLRNPRIDLLSVSGHKAFGPKGVGALIVRKRGFQRAPLAPVFFGGGQERGLRPGTLPVPLIVGLGVAAKLALKHHAARRERCIAFREKLLAALEPLEPVITGEPSRLVPHTLNLYFRGLDSEAVIVALKDRVALSNGSACTSHKYEPSHVLMAMGMASEAVAGAVRLSWCHMTEEPDWSGIVKVLQGLR